MSDSALDIERPQPWPRTVLVPRHVKYCALVDGSWVCYVVLVASKTFGLPAAGGNAPHVVFAGCLDASHKIDPLSVRRPGLKVIVPTGDRIYKDLLGIGATAIRYEHGIAGCIGVIH